MKITVQHTGDGCDPDAILKAAEMDYVPFSTVQRILEAGGYSIQIEAAEKNPEKTQEN